MNVGGFGLCTGAAVAWSFPVPMARLTTAAMGEYGAHLWSKTLKIDGNSPVQVLDE